MATGVAFRNASRVSRTPSGIAMISTKKVEIAVSWMCCHRACHTCPFDRAFEEIASSSACWNHIQVVSRTTTRTEGSSVSFCQVTLGAGAVSGGGVSSVGEVPSAGGTAPVAGEAAGLEVRPGAETSSGAETPSGADTKPGADAKSASVAVVSALMPESVSVVASALIAESASSAVASASSAEPASPDVASPVVEPISPAPIRMVTLSTDG